jgi:hypothetical protein
MLLHGSAALPVPGTHTHPHTHTHAHAHAHALTHTCIYTYRGNTDAHYHGGVGAGEAIYLV